MSNDSIFKTIQQDPCDTIDATEEKPIDRVCPTCIPNDSYAAPDWWTQTAPWLNQKHANIQLLFLLIKRVKAIDYLI